MNPELDKILKQAYQDMDTKGVPEAQRKELLTKLANDFNSAQGGEQKDRGILGVAEDIGKSIVKPFDVVGKSILAPFATGDTKKSYDEGKAKNMLDFAGNALEVASYGMAPLKLGGGLFSTLASIAPAAATYGAGKGAEELAKSGDAMSAVGEAGAGYAGVTAGFGLLKGAGSFIKSFGARALQNPAVQSAFSSMKQTAENIWSSLPEVFQSGADLSNLTNATTRRTVNALKADFNKNYDVAKNAVIDSMVPTVNNPDLTLGKFQRSLSEKMGNMFRETNTLYDDVKADNTTISRFTRASEALGKLPESPTIGAKATASELKAFTEAQNRMSPAIMDFAEQMKPALNQPLTLRQIMSMWEQSMSYIPKANNEERTIIRDFAAGLYADARSVLEKTNPELQKQFDLAYKAWQKSSDIYGSGILSRLKTVGDVDSFVHKMMSQKMDIPEKKAFLESVGTEDTATQDLFINSILRNAKKLKPNDGAKLIGDFLDNWGDEFLSPDQAKMLDDTRAFLSGNFDEFVLGIRKATGLDQKVAETLQGQSEQIDLTKMVDDTRLGDISNKFTKLKDSPELEKIMQSFTPDEKNVIGLSITKDLFKKELPVFIKSEDGSFKLEDGYADAVLKTWGEIQGNKALQKLFTPDQLTAFETAAKDAEKLKDVSFKNDEHGLANVARVFVSLFYANRGWVPGALSNIGKVLKSGSDTKLFRDTINEMVKDGSLRKNVAYTIDDWLNIIARAGMPQASATAAEGD